MNRFCGSTDFFIACILFAVTDIVPYASGEQVRSLQNIAEPVLKPELTALAVIRTVNKNAPFGRFIEPANKVHDCALAGTCFTDECDGLALFNHKTEIFQHFFAAVVCKTHIAKFNIAADVLPVFAFGVHAVTVFFNNFGSVRNIAFGVKQRNNAFGTRLRTLHFREYTCKLLNRVKQVGGVRDEG